MRYSDIDRLLYWSVDRRRSHEQLLAMGFAADQIERVEKLVAGSEFKRQTRTDRQARSTNAGRRLSVPAPKAKAERRVAETAPKAAHCTWSPRRSATWATSACAPWTCCGRAAGRRRGHALARRLWARHDDRDAPDEFPRTVVARRPTGSVAVTFAAAPIWRSSPMPGRRWSATRARSSWLRGRGRAGKSCPYRERRPSCPRWWAVAFRPLVGRSRVSCRARARSVATAGPDLSPTTGRRCCSRRPAGWQHAARTWRRRAAPERPAALARELTKLHEEFWRGTLGELAARASREDVRGEVTLVVAGADPDEGPTMSLDEGRGEVERLVAARA